MDQDIIKELLENQKLLLEKVDYLTSLIEPKTNNPYSNICCVIPTLSNFISSIKLYIDIDEVMFEEVPEGMTLKPGFIEFFNWCKPNFDLIWVTSKTTNEFEDIFKKSNCNPLLQGSKMIEKRFSKNEEDFIDIYSDFYILTTHKMPTSINKLKDSGWQEYKKVVSMKKTLISKIKEQLFDRLNEKIKIGREEIALANSDLFFSSYCFKTSWYGPTCWYFEHKEIEGLKVTIHLGGDMLLNCTWVVSIPNICEERPYKQTIGYENLVTHLETLPHIMRELICEYEKDNPF